MILQSTTYIQQCGQILHKCFVHPIFGFWSILATKLWKYYIIFVYILKGKMGKVEKNRKKIHSTKEAKNQKTKIWDEWNIRRTFEFFEPSYFISFWDSSNLQKLCMSISEVEKAYKRWKLRLMNVINWKVKNFLLENRPHFAPLSFRLDQFCVGRHPVVTTMGWTILWMSIFMIFHIFIRHLDSA